MCVFSRLIRVGSRCWKTQMHGQHSSNKKTNVSLLGLRLPGQWGEYNRLERSGRGGGGGALAAWLHYQVYIALNFGDKCRSDKDDMRCQNINGRT